MNSVSSPKDDAASRRAAATAEASSASCAHEVHPLATAPGGGLDEHGESDVEGRRDELLVAEPRLGEAGHDGNSPFRHLGLRPDLVAHRRQRIDARPDEDDPGLGTGRGERRVLGEESVARVDGLRALGEGGRHDLLDVEVAVGCRRGPEAHRDIREADVAGARICVAVDGDRTDAERAQSVDDAAGDFAAVGDQNGVEHGAVGHSAVGHGRHILKTP